MMPTLSGKPAPRFASSPAAPGRVVDDFLGRLRIPCRLLVAYSGGGDSTGLLVALAERLRARPDLEVSLFAATVDHGLRPGSAEEARAAGALCEKLSIPHHVLTWEGQKPATGIQAAAREARYRLLGQLAGAMQADLIVTAHNLDDQVETLAMRRARNADAAGGISSAVLYDRHVWVVRPFLDLRRADIRDFLRARQIGWVDDPSNDSVKFERVRIRKSQDRDAEVADFQAIEHSREQLAAETARYLRASVSVHSARVAVVDLSGHDAENPAHLQAVLHLAAMMGGREHLAGRETAGHIAGFLASQEDHRLAAERVVFDRRKHLLYITREKRSLPMVTVEPGSSIRWDNRFRIVNHNSESVCVGVRSGEGRALIGDDLPAEIPGAVSQRIKSTEPILLEGRFDALSATPIITQFDRFLPLAMLAVANALAFHVGLDHFPGLPTR